LSARPASLLLYRRLRSHASKRSNAEGGAACLGVRSLREDPICPVERIPVQHPSVPQASKRQLCSVAACTRIAGFPGLADASAAGASKAAFAAFSILLLGGLAAALVDRLPCSGGCRRSSQQSTTQVTRCRRTTQFPRRIGRKSDAVKSRPRFSATSAAASLINPAYRRRGHRTQRCLALKGTSGSSQRVCEDAFRGSPPFVDCCDTDGRRCGGHRYAAWRLPDKAFEDIPGNEDRELSRLRYFLTAARNTFIMSFTAASLSFDSTANSIPADK
jgi:hypothetical protein